jgi:hypothetical protein
MTTPPFDVTERVELMYPQDRVRGTVVSSSDAVFVVKYDDGMSLAYPQHLRKEFMRIPDKPIPVSARHLIHRLRQVLGRTPPEDVCLVRGGPVIPQQADARQNRVDEPAALTPEAEDGSIEA